MADYLTCIDTPLSPDDAFAYMADMTHFTEWDPSVRRAIRVAGDGHSTGTVYELTVQAGGTTVLRYEVQVYEPPRRIVLVARTRLLVSHDEVRIEATRRGAMVTYDAKLLLRGPLHLFDPLLGLAFQRLGDRAAAGLRRALRAEERHG